MLLIIIGCVLKTLSVGLVGMYLSLRIALELEWWNDNK